MTAHMQPVSGSSFIAGVGYDPASEVLTVQFKDGKMYAYDNVDSGTYEEFISASSSGKFWHSRIKDNYSSRQA